MLVRLKAKLAEIVNGLDLSHCDEGDVIDVADRDGRMLLAERWAELVAETDVVSSFPKQIDRAVAADEGHRGWRKTAKDEWPEHGFTLMPPGGPEREP
jgi:hypothetical protein